MITHNIDYEKKKPIISFLRIEWSLFVKHWVSSPKNVLCQFFWRRFLNFVSVLSLFHNYLPLEKDVALHLKKLEFPSPIKLCAKFAWLKLAQAFCKKIFKFLRCALLFRNYLPYENGVALHLNKHEFPSPKDALCQVWLKFVSNSAEEDENVKNLRQQ